MIPLIRQATLEDLPIIYGFALESGAGITSLPQDKKILEKKLYVSERSFKEALATPVHETYQFCLEWEGQVIGTASIVSRVGMTEPFYAYHLRHEPQICSHLNMNTQLKVLHFIKARKKPTEIGALFLSHSFRHKNFGKLLSLSRFLFMATHRERFAPIVIAELRGINHDGYSPFWEAVGSHFFHLTFREADILRVRHHACIEELFPTHPLYVELLSQTAQAVIGETHPNTVPAKKMLEKQGFKFSQYVDIFDAGPHMYSPTDEIDTVKTSQTAIVTALEQKEGREAIVSNTLLDFRATLASISIKEGDATLSPEIASALHLGIGSPIRYYYLS